MSLFQAAENKAAYLKMGLMGFAGSGKTHTASLVAIGLYKAAVKKGMAYAERPVFFVDTEAGSDYIVDLFAREKVPLQVARTRAFADLVTAMKEAEQHAGVLIIDSITHFWTEFQEAYKAKKKRTRGLEFQDWANVKQEWRKSFTEPFLNTNLHIIMCGRASYEYDHHERDDGKREIHKSGVKMSAEKEMGFEPSLLVFLERDTDLEGKTHRTAIVMKDRFRDLDGKEIPNPTFKSFVPHIEKLNWGGSQGGVDVTRTSEDMIEPDQYDRRRTDREIVLDQISDLLTKHFSTSQADKIARIELLETAFGNSAKAYIEKRCSLEDLQIGYDRCHLQLTGKPSVYSRGDMIDIEDLDEIPHANGAEKPRISAKEVAERQAGEAQ